MTAIKPDALWSGEPSAAATRASASPVAAELYRKTFVLDGNVLGEIGKGHKVALNTLNFGRFKLGAMSAGGCKASIGEAARYGNPSSTTSRTATATTRCVS